MKVLMALLDEDALAPPCLNKADLLSEDQPVLGGGEANGILALFRLCETVRPFGANVVRERFFFGSRAQTPGRRSKPKTLFWACNVETNLTSKLSLII